MIDHCQTEFSSDSSRFTALLEWIISISALMAGSILLGLANGTLLDPIFLSSLLLIIGIAANLLVRDRYAQRAFVLSYCACVLIAGLSQIYSQFVFGVPMSGIDANMFFNLVKKSHYLTFDALVSLVNAPLAVSIWQNVYSACTALGLHYGPWIGVLFNSFVVGLTGSVTIFTGRQLFGDDDYRLRRIGTLFALCGMFWLFGALFLRDCFVLLINTLVLWVFVRVLRAPKVTNLLLTASVLAIASFSMQYLRSKSVPLLVLFGFVCFFCWYWRSRFNWIRFLATSAVSIALIILYPFILDYVQTSLDIISEESTDYIAAGYAKARKGSLGMSLIMTQILPIRLFSGSAFLLINPIPLWASLKYGASEYHLIKTWHGIFIVLIMPQVLVGLAMTLRQVHRKKEEIMPAFFVTLFSVIALLSVAATSMETRHYGQFVPALILLAAMPDTRRHDTRSIVLYTYVIWFSLVVMVHVVWAVMRFCRG